jgi:tRNA pseudouridine38-40 synthase
VRIALGIEYDGRPYSGWQSQKHAPSVQAELEAAVARVADHTVRLQCAGRTDAGVHACGQVAHFDTVAARGERAWVLGANSNLPGAISVTWARAVDPGFDARYSALSRVYRYIILNRYTRSALYQGRAAWICPPLAVEPMRAAARLLLGRRDFTSFRAQGCQARTPIRTLHRFDVWRSDDFVCMELEADAFLQHMVRNLAGTLIAIGGGTAPPAWAAAVLEQRDRRAAAATAPADGLYFLRVTYPQRYSFPTPYSAHLPGASRE